jgi:PTS system nitrogen regulatory IIA component
VNRLLTLRQVAEVLQVNERTALRLAHAGALPAMRVGSQWRVHPGELERWFWDTRHVEREEPPVPTALFHEDRVLLDHPAADRRALFEAIAERLAALGHLIYPRLYVEAMLAREAKMSTGVGDGVALPHARHGINELFRAPLCVFVRPAAPIEFAAIDGAPVDLVFALAAPTESAHLSSLAALMRIARSETARARLRAARSAADALAVLDPARPDDAAGSGARG